MLFVPALFKPHQDTTPTPRGTSRPRLCGIGDLNAAFEWLRYATANKELFNSWLIGSPLHEPVRADARHEVLFRTLRVAP